MARTKKKVTKGTKKVKKTQLKSKKMAKPTSPKWHQLILVLFLVLGVLAAGAMMMDKNLLSQIQGSLLAQDSNQEAPLNSGDPLSGGILITWNGEGENENKLLDIFRTVFPDTGIHAADSNSELGSKLVSDLGLEEVPVMVYAQDAFEQESLSEVVRDLFVLKNGYYVLNSALVNPSHQLRLVGPLNEEGGFVAGQADAPLSMHLYSDPECQHCRAHEANITDKVNELLAEGMLRVVYLDLPQDSDSMYHSVALACVADMKPGSYLNTRASLYARANLTNAFTSRTLEDLGISLENDCDESAYKRIMRTRLRIADEEGVTGIPAAYLSATGSNQYIRLTGEMAFSEYQAVFDSLLSEINSGAELIENLIEGTGN